MKIIEFFKGKRVFTATIFIAITLLACIVGSIAWALYILVLILFGVDEFIRLLKAKGVNPAREHLYIFSVLFIIVAFFNKPEYFIHVIVFCVIIIFMGLLFRNRKVTINDISATLLGIMYAGLMPVHFILIRNLPPTDVILFPYIQLQPGAGAGYLLLIMISICASDIAAYYVGTKLGKTPLWPSISPKKTVEGAIGGTSAGILTSIIIGYFIHLNILHSFILGVIIVTMAQLGDLCESLIKRDVGVKDSGDIVPGHGGVLDRTDSYIFTAPLAYYYLQWIVLKLSQFTW